MKLRFRTARILLLLGMATLSLLPGRVLAHDNLGGDELAMSNLMLIGAMIVIVMGIIAGIWAWQAGQFNNVEESKYRMIDIADNYDEIMAEFARAEAAAKEVESQAPPAGPTRGLGATSSSLPTSVGAGNTAKVDKVTATATITHTLDIT